MDTRFKIYTGLLKAYEENGTKRFRTTASSTISDLVGDEILPPAIEKMAEKARGNLTIFLNHEYKVPEDVLGSVESTSMATRGVDGEGNPIVDLDFDIKVNDSNPRALQTFEAIKSGVRLGTSIGAIVKHATKKKGGGLRIDDLELLEASIVGIPANPRSWVQYAAKSLRGVELDEESIVEDEPVEKSVELAPEVEPELTLALCSTCNKSSDTCDCEDCSCRKDVTPEVTAEVEPDKEAARTLVTVTVDSEGAQDAPRSQPEAALTDEERADAPSDTATAALGDTVTRSASAEVFDTSGLANLVKQLQDVVAENQDLRKKYDEVKAAADDANENLAVAREIINRIADLPIGRKTHFQAAVDDYRTKFPQYDAEFLKFLEK